MDQIGELLLGMGTLAAAIWITAEGLGNATKIHKLWFAFPMGILGGLVLRGVGLFEIHEPGTHTYGVAMWEYGLAAMLGLLATGIAASGNDLLKWYRERQAGPPTAPPRNP